MPFSRESLRAILRYFAIIILLANCSTAAAQVVFQPYEVHIGYVIASNRQAEPNGFRLAGRVSGNPKLVCRPDESLLLRPQDVSI
jgi:hypothetical protein